MAKLQGKYVADNTIEESKLKISNEPTNDYVLTADSGATGGLKWSLPSTPDTHDVKVSANDTTPGFLSGKINGETNKLIVTELNDGGNESLGLSIGSDILDLSTDTTDDITEGSTNKYYPSGATAGASELNILDGATLTTAELNYVDGVTSDIQTQLNNKQSTLTFGIANGNAVDIDSASVADNDYAKFTANGLEGRSYSEIRDDLSLATSDSPTFANVTSSNNATANNHLVRLDQMNSVISGLHWQEAIEEAVDIPPVSPVIGARYIVDEGGEGAWSGHDGDIVEWNGSSWDFETPEEGWTVWNKAEDTNFTFNGTSWVEFGSTVSHYNLTGLQGGQTAQRYHLTSSQHTVATQAAGSTQSGYLTSANWSTFNAKQNSLTFGIANTNTVVINSTTVADNEYARFTASGLESRSVGEVLSDIGAITASSSDTLTNKTIDDNNNNTLSIDYTSLKPEADGSLITWSSSGDLTVVNLLAPGTSGKVLTSNGTSANLSWEDAPVSSRKVVKTIALTGTEITNGYSDNLLDNVPSEATAVELCPVGGIPQEYSVDFNVVSSGGQLDRISWLGLGLAPLLEVGDKVTVNYTY